MSTNLVEQITAKAAALSYEKQREALAIIESLAAGEKKPAGRRTRTLKGATADGTPSVSSEEIDEARREMWHG
jgi:hypothetical protein